MTLTRCRFCRCTDEVPCVLPNGDQCMLSQATGLCTNSQCVMAAQREARTMSARRREELAGMVRPIAESWRRSWAKDREQRRRPGTKKKKAKGLTGRAA